MSNRKSEKERRRQLRLSQQQAAEQQAKRRQRRIYAVVGAALIALAAVAVALTASSGGGSPSAPPAVAAAQPLSGPTNGPRGGGVLAANTREANQILDTTIQAKVAHLSGAPVVINHGPRGSAPGDVTRLWGGDPEDRIRLIVANAVSSCPPNRPRLGYQRRKPPAA